MILSAQNLLVSYSDIVGNLFDISFPLSDSTSNDLFQLEFDFVDLWDEFFVDDLIIKINPLIRPAVSSSLDSVQKLLDNDKISFEIAKSIDKIIFASIFYYEIGDKTKAIDLLTDAFVDIKNVNPEKVTNQRAPTFDKLEETLLNLMKKSDTIMSKSVKTEVGFIFARGTAPVFSDEIGELIVLLSKSRYLDVVSRKQSDLYRLVQNDWDSLKPSLMAKESIAELVSSSIQVTELH